MPDPSAFPQARSVILSAAKDPRISPRSAPNLQARFRQLLRSKLLQATFLAVLTIAFMGATQSRFDRLGHQMICMCGCGQILLECNHLGCPVSPVMINELHQQLAAGGTDTAIFNWFAAKYGAVALASPIRGGFDNVAWITPFAVFFLATAGTAFTVWAWRKRTLRLAPTGPAVPHAGSAWVSSDMTPEAQALRDRIRQETEYR